MTTCPKCNHVWEEPETEIHEHTEHSVHTTTHEGLHEQLELVGDVRFEGDGVLRYESAVSDRKPQIDRVNHMMIGVRGMNAKKTRKDYYYGLEAQKEVVLKYEGMVVGMNHDYKQGPPTIERSLGKVIKAYTDENGTLFDIQYNPAHERMEQILVDAETGLNTISPSCITNRCEQRGDVVTSFVPAGIDFVVNAGQTTKMFEQTGSLHEQTGDLPKQAGSGMEVSGVQAIAPTVTPTMSTETDTRLEQALKDIDFLKGKLGKIEQIAPATVIADVQRMEQAITQRGVDLEAFHAEFMKVQ